MEGSPGRWSADLLHLSAPMRGVDIKCFEEGWSEGVGCGERLFPEGKESSLQEECAVSVPADRGLSAEEGWRPHTPSRPLSAGGVCAPVLSGPACLFFLLYSWKVGYTAKADMGQSYLPSAGSDSCRSPGLLLCGSQRTEGCKLCFLYAPVLRSPWRW